MAGLVKQKMTGKLSPTSVRAGMKMPPELQEAYDRVVIAGMKGMCSKETNKLVMKAMEGDKPLPNRLGVGIAGLMATLYRQSNKTIPPQVLIPAGTDLLSQAADFLKRTGKEKIDDKATAQALEIMVRTILEMFHVDPAKMATALSGYSRTAGQQQQAQMMRG